MDDFINLIKIIYASPFFLIYFLITVVVLILLLLITINTYSNVRINRKVEKSLEPFQFNLTQKNKGDFMSSLFSRARNRADTEKIDSNNGNTDSFEEVVSSFMVSIDRQNLGFAQLIAIGSFINEARSVFKSNEDLIKEAREYILDSRSNFDEESKNAIISALENNPKELLSQAAEALKLAKNESGEDVKSDGIDEVQLDQKQVESSKKYQVEGDARQYIASHDCMRNCFSTYNVDPTSQFDFSDLANNLIVRLCTSLEGKKYDTEIKAIYKFISSFKKGCYNACLSFELKKLRKNVVFLYFM